MPPQHVLPNDVAGGIVAVELNKARRHAGNAARGEPVPPIQYLYRRKPVTTTLLESASMLATSSSYSAGLNVAAHGAQWVPREGHAFGAEGLVCRHYFGALVPANTDVTRPAFATLCGGTCFEWRRRVVRPDRHRSRGLPIVRHLITVGADDFERSRSTSSAADAKPRRLSHASPRSSRAPGTRQTRQLADRLEALRICRPANSRHVRPHSVARWPRAGQWLGAYSQSRIIYAAS